MTNTLEYSTTNDQTESVFVPKQSDLTMTKCVKSLGSSPAEGGDHPEFEALYGIRCTASRNYPERTERNVIDADATFIFGDIFSPGCRLTKRLCEKHGKRWLNIYFPLQPHDKAQFMYMLSLSSAVGPNAVYNVAGNRESNNPGIGAFTKSCLSAWYWAIKPTR